ncbi:iron-containing alcohol dehydrogenase [Actinomycetes bacterium KLBMP 9797]
MTVASMGHDVGSGSVVGRIEARLDCEVEVEAVPGLFDPGNTALLRHLREARRLLVVVDAGRAAPLRAYLDRQVWCGKLDGYTEVDSAALDHLSPLAAVERIAEEAASSGLGRRDAFLSYCGPVVSDYVLITAALFRRHTRAVRLVAGPAGNVRPSPRTALPAAGLAVRHREVRVVVPDASPSGRSQRGVIEQSYRVELAPSIFTNPADPLRGWLPAGAKVLAVVDAFAPHVVADVRRYFSGHTVVPVVSSAHAKTLGHVGELLTTARRLGLGRDDRIVAVGGGMLLDLVGTMALLYQGETPYLRVPTTLVGLIDAGVGLKVGVDVNQRRNLLGGYQPPLACLCDTAFLRTLPPAEIRCGLAEAIKIAMVADGSLLDLLEERHEDLFERPDGPVAEEIVRRSIAAMMRELAGNPYEKELRRLPDFGHEFGHLLETASGYALRHGEAVSIGMAFAGHLGVQTGRLPAAAYERMIRLLLRVGLPVYSPLCRPERLWRWLGGDISAHKGGRPHLVVPTGVGSGGFIDSMTELNPDLLRRACADLVRRRREVAP